MEYCEYTKDELKASERFKESCDAIEALLKDGVMYTVEEAEEIIRNFMEGSV